jgi:hypothetical protein
MIPKTRELQGKQTIYLYRTKVICAWSAHAHPTAASLKVQLQVVHCEIATLFAVVCVHVCLFGLIAFATSETEEANERV